MTLFFHKFSYHFTPVPENCIFVQNLPEMKVSLQWLKEYVDIPWEAQELSDRLTLAGLEVEGIEAFESVPGGLEGVVVGEVLSAEQHPNADRLKVCSVNLGNGEPVQIVCGAPNVAAGQKVPVATVGSTLYPAEGDSFKIKRSKIRGELSEGMICAEDELGIGTDHDGIMVLEAGLKPGTPAAAVFGLESDTVLEIGLTPNRVDAASHYGTARDVAALTQRKARLPEIPEIPANAPKGPVAIELPEADKCPRYTGIYISGVKVAPSPEWLQNRLRSVGLRPINNVVDVTNFVLHELGHPLHAFDADRIRGRKIVVRTLESDTKFTTLDDEERLIRGGKDLMICDGEGPVAVAGVMGGQNSEVDDNTQNIFLESAYFNPDFIRATAAHLGLKTDASYRFERGADPEMTVTAAKRTADLIIQLAGGTLHAVDDVRKADFPPYRIRFDMRRANQLMGTAFDPEDVKPILELLDISCEIRSKHEMDLTVPLYRVDVTRPQDVMEEILRIYGYNNVPMPSETRITPGREGKDEAWDLRQKYFNYLSSAGYSEMIANALVPGRYAGEHTVNLLNNLSEELAVMRASMLWTGLEIVSYNHNRRNTDLRLFEFGKTYHRDGDQFEEKEWVALFLSGQRQPLHWSQKAERVSFFTLSREIERLQTLFGFAGKTEELEPDVTFDYGLALYAGKKLVARYGKVAAARQREFDIKEDVFYAEIDWQAVLTLHGGKLAQFEELPRFPAIRRDVSMLVPDSLRFAEVRNAVRNANPKLIREVGISDVYAGPNVPEGRKSYLINITLLDPQKTLTDEAADKVMNRVFGILERDLGAEIRK